MLNEQLYLQLYIQINDNSQPTYLVVGSEVQMILGAALEATQGVLGEMPRQGYLPPLPRVGAPGEGQFPDGGAAVIHGAPRHRHRVGRRAEGVQECGAGRDC